MRLRKAFWLALLATWAIAMPLWAQGGTDAATDADAAAEDPKASGSDSDEASSDKGGGATQEGADAGSEGEGKSAPTPPGPGEAAAGAASAEGALDGATYLVRMRDLEQRVDRRKEPIRRSHTRLSLLSETVLAGGVGGSRAQIKFTNDLTTAYRLERALIVLDGAVQYNKQDASGKLAKQHEIPVFTGTIPPGDHTVQVLLRLRGHGYGVFSYLQGFRFEVKSAHSFTVTEGKTIAIDIIIWEKGGITTPLEQRPAIRYVEQLRSGAVGASSDADEKPKGAGVSSSLSIGSGEK